jgi:hypothetical protein
MSYCHCLWALNDLKLTQGGYEVAKGVTARACEAVPEGLNASLPDQDHFKDGSDLAMEHF